MNKNDPTAFGGPLTLREEPQQMQRDVHIQTLQVRAASVNEQERSVEVIMATDAPVTVWDWERGIIDEVLVADGGSFPDSMPLLENHMRWSLDCVLGAVRNSRRDGASSWVGKAFFAADDEPAQRAWNKVKQRMLTDVSIGYRSTEYEDIPPNTSKTINGRSYTAQNRWLRVSKRWEAKELSLVPIGADQQAKVRGAGVPPTNPTPVDSGRKVPMDPKLRKYLESIGLRHDASEDQAKAFLESLGGQQKQRADAIVAGTMTLEQATRSDADGDEEDDEAEGEREETDEDDDEDEEEGERGAGRLSRRNKPGKNGKNGKRGKPRGDRDRVREDAVRVERERVAAIRKLAGNDVPTELYTRAVDEGWDTARASTEFLNAIRQRRGTSVGTDAPGGIVRDHKRDGTTNVLAFAMMQRAGVNLERYAKRANVADWANIATRSDQYRRLSLIDICRHAIRIDGREAPIDPIETIRAGVSGGALTSIFTTSVNASILMAWDEVADTTQGWVEEVDVADFKLQTVIDAQSKSQLEKLPRGQTAKHASMEDSEITYKISRFAKQFVIDEQDMIDDSYDVLQRMPAEMGRAAARLRPDLVYAILLANPTISGGALFNSTALSTTGGHANSTTGALAASTLKTSINLMGKQYILDGKPNVVSRGARPNCSRKPSRNARRTPRQRAGLLR